MLKTVISKLRKSVGSITMLYAVTLLAIPGSPMQAAEESNNGLIKFVFAPPDGTTVIQTLTTLREKHLGPTAKQMDEAVSKTKLTIKRTDKGFDVIAQPISAVMRRNGRVVRSPLIDLLSKTTITYKLDKNGVLTDIVGFDQVTEVVNAQFPPEIAKKLAPMLNSETLKQKEKAEWNGRIGDYLGKSVKLGEIWEYVAPYTLPNGTVIKYKMKIHFSAFNACNGKKCLRIDQVYSSDPKGLAEFTNKTLKSAVEGTGKASGETLPTVNQGGSSLEGKASRLIDPHTMLIYGESLERTINMKMKLPGGETVETKTVEKRIYKFEY